MYKCIRKLFDYISGLQHYRELRDSSCCLTLPLDAIKYLASVQPDRWIVNFPFSLYKYKGRYWNVYTTDEDMFEYKKWVPRYENARYKLRRVKQYKMLEPECEEVMKNFVDIVNITKQLPELSYDI